MKQIQILLILCNHMPLQKLAFAAEGCYSSLWLLATNFLIIVFGCRHSWFWSKCKAFGKLQRGYSQPAAATVCCIWRSQHLRNPRDAAHSLRLSEYFVPFRHNISEVGEAICDLRLPQIVVANGHNIWKIPVQYGHYMLQVPGRSFHK